MQAADIAQRLQLALGSGTACNLRQLTGGATKQTWCFDWTGPAGTETLVLQRSDAVAARPGEPPRLDAAQDAALMQAAVRAGVPAPVVRVVLQPQHGLGTGYVTGHVAGETLGRKLATGSAFAGARQRLAAQCGAALAAIHRMPTAELPFLARLSPADELAIYGGMLQRHAIAHPALAWALRWVGQNLPQHWEPRVVHADFRNGNLIVDAEGLRCVLDWEIARIGDPMQDLGTLCMRSWRFGGAGEAGGFGQREDLYAAYEAAGGGAVDPARVRFWEAFGNLKWAIACVRRALGTGAGGRAASLELCAVGRRLEEPLWDFFALTGAAP